jgi:hypothetical protein
MRTISLVHHYYGRKARPPSKVHGLAPFAFTYVNPSGDVVVEQRYSWFRRPRVRRGLDPFLGAGAMCPKEHRSRETGRAQKGTILSPPLFDTAPDGPNDCGAL